MRRGALLVLMSSVDVESLYGATGPTVPSVAASAELLLWPAGKPAPGDEGHNIGP